jgi:excisionase family DNA binding protein
MGDPALEASSDHLTVEGLEHVLEGGDTGDDLSPGDIMAPGDRGGDMWTLDEATRLLGVTKRTVLRKLKSGELTGYKVPGPFGQEWRIYPGDKAGDMAGDLSPAIASPDDLGVSPPVPALVEELRRQLDELKSENQSLQKELQAASWRNGYLESQVQSQDTQIKLLTDSQHTAGWWRRFCSWFTGR